MYVIHDDQFKKGILTEQMNHFKKVHICLSSHKAN